MESLRCVVERITYQNEQNGYTVLRGAVKGSADLVTVVGLMPEVHAGSVLVCQGEWRMDAKYGRQFSARQVEERLPATAYGMEKYLGSGLVRGVGPAFASRIVRQFGADTLDVIDSEPERLLEVPGIGPTRLSRIRQSWAEQKEIRNIMLFLQSHNVSTAHATRIFRSYGAESLKIVQENPYRLADDIWGIGFRTADAIAMKLGFEADSYLRLRSGLLYTLHHLSDEGHCFAEAQQLLETGVELLSAEKARLSDALSEMILDGDVIAEALPAEGDTAPSQAIYLPPLYQAERGTAMRLMRILRAPPSVLLSDQASLLSSDGEPEYDEVQLRAIREAAEQKILILTGGPGTGKTTTTLGILRRFRLSNARILLAAPTGRAARRLSEATGMEAKTIHRLLEFKPPEGYQKNEQSPLEGDVLIVDECSMIDLMLMLNLLKAIPDGMRLILVGDIDQLPSVGAGNVLRDLIESDCFPVVRLTRIFRQAQTSRIVLSAHRVNRGQLPDLSNGRDSDFFFVDMEKQLRRRGLDPEDTELLARETANCVVEHVAEKLPRYSRLPPSDIQVLTPMQRGLIGTSELNRLLQEKLNPGDQGMRRGGQLFKPGDRVMQIRNNYEKEVFNGDIGVILSLNREDGLLNISFDGRTVSYEQSELDELVLAYAATIHKSQGSEYPAVVIPLLMSHYVMLQRNLLYTGITRAKRLLVLIGTRKALNRAVKHVTVSRRNTRLKERLQALARSEAPAPAFLFAAEPQADYEADKLH